MSNNKKKSIANKNRKQEKKYILFLLFAVVLFIVVLIGTVFNDCLKIYENRRQTKAYEELYTLLLEEEASLNSEVVKLQDPDYVARYARERYGFTKDGETILTIIDGEFIKSSINKEK